MLTRNLWLIKVQTITTKTNKQAWMKGINMAKFRNPSPESNNRSTFASFPMWLVFPISNQAH